MVNCKIRLSEGFFITLCKKVYINVIKTNFLNLNQFTKFRKQRKVYWNICLTQ